MAQFGSLRGLRDLNRKQAVSILDTWLGIMFDIDAGYNVGRNRSLGFASDS